MAGNENTSNTSAPKPKPAEKKSAVSGVVKIDTNTFDPLRPMMLDRAADVFKEQYAETHGDSTVKVTSVTLAKHVIGHSVEYNVTGEIAE